MEKQAPTPDQIAQAVKAVMDILGQPTATALAEALKTYVNLDVENINTVTKLALFEQGLKLIFHQGANPLLRRLDFEMRTLSYKDSGTRMPRTVQNAVRKA